MLLKVCVIRFKTSYDPKNVNRLVKGNRTGCLFVDAVKDRLLTRTQGRHVLVIVRIRRGRIDQNIRYYAGSIFN